MAKMDRLVVNERDEPSAYRIRFHANAMSPVGRSDHLDLVHAPNEVSNPALPQSTQYAAKSSNQQYRPRHARPFRACSAAALGVDAIFVAVHFFLLASRASAAAAALARRGAHVEHRVARVYGRVQRLLRSR